MNRLRWAEDFLLSGKESLQLYLRLPFMVSQQLNGAHQLISWLHHNLHNLAKLIDIAELIEFSYTIPDTKELHTFWKKCINLWIVILKTAQLIYTRGTLCFWLTRHAVWTLSWQCSYLQSINITQHQNKLDRYIVLI